ncbi:MAG: hypothetical protein KH025_09930 [Megasphaera sp.]|uniref:sigma factor-like helix-turn-helix DNA-binding protein n=1 Tax=Megasphaera sp. TaxID=2023260 RepID=UPI0025BD0D8C|nr:sigma factor-like helix-turn-helix DNA-binding protein [Megasphaera sp.]MBS7223531.1 hypothetical protein [Megasphaera sp.]
MYRPELPPMSKLVTNPMYDETLTNISKDYETMTDVAVNRSVDRIAGTFAKSWAFAEFLSRKLNKKKTDLRIAIYHKPIESTEIMYNAAIRGLLSQGVQVIDCTHHLFGSYYRLLYAIRPSRLFSVPGVDGILGITGNHLREDSKGLHFIFGCNENIRMRMTKEILTLATTLYTMHPSSKAVTFLDLKKQMEKDFRYLNNDERQVLSLRFGLTDGHYHTRKEVGQYFNVPWEDIRRIENEALEALSKLRDENKEILNNVLDEYETMSEAAVNRTVNYVAGTAAKSETFAEFISQKLNKKMHDLRIAIGRNPEHSEETIYNAVISGLLNQGVQITDCGECLSPTLFLYISESYRSALRHDGAIWVTASQPGNVSGLRFNSNGNMTKQELKKILALAATKYALPVSSENIFFWDAEKQIKSMEEAFTVLSERERQVLSVGFGLIDGHIHSIEETARFYKVTRVRIRSVEGRALSTIRNWYHHQEKLKLYITNQKEDDSLA